MGIRRALISWLHSLSGRMLISILLIHLVLLTALFYSILKLVEKNYTEQFIGDVRMDSQRVSQLVMYELKDYDQEKLDGFLEDLMLSGQLASIAIKDPFGKLIYPSDKEVQKNYKFFEDFFFGENNDLFYCVRHQLITANGENIGALQLAYNETSVVEEVDKLYQSGLIVMAIYMIIVLVFTGVMDTYLTQPLRNLARDANRIASGKYREKFSTETDVNEVKFLTESLESMRSELVNRGEKLADGEKRIKTLVNNITDAVVVCDLKGKIDSLNKSITTLSGYNIENLSKQNISRLISFEELIAHVKKISTERTYETFLINKDGIKVPVEVNVSKMQQGKEFVLLILLRDIKERKRGEVERFQYHNDMAHAGRLGIMGEMAAGIAHELNQPLAAISLYLQGCVRRCEKCAPDEMNKEEMFYAIKSADEQATRAAGIIRRIKSFVRKEAESESLEIVDINFLVKRSVKFVLLDKRFSIIQPELHLSSEVLNVKVDGLQIEQVLVNLIRNAIEAILHKSNKPDFLKIFTSIDIDKSIKVCVLDSGCGVENQNIDKIFDTYFTTKLEGLGMGLAISRSIIEEHNGMLWYRSGEEYGSQFCFILPPADIAA